MKKKINIILTLLLVFTISITSVKAEEKHLKYTDGNSNNKIDQGDEICFGDECFFVVYTDDDKAYALAKYNLLVGNKSIGTQVYDLISYDVKPLENETGIQDKRAIGGIKNVEDTFYGTVKFEEEKLEKYIDNYVKYIKRKSGIDVIGRIPDADDAHYLDCDISDSCENTPSWAKNTTYWLSFDSYIISRDTSLSKPLSQMNYTVDSLVGLRPIIGVNLDDIEKYNTSDEIDNPETIDNISFMYMLFILGIVGISYGFILKKKYL